MTVTVRWDGTLTALSSISHGGESRGLVTLLRRETVVVDGQLKPVPVVSGNSIRGRLRRIGEELLRDVLGYQGQLTLPAAHALRAGGALAKTAGEPLSGQRLADLRAVVPQIGVFGCAAGGRIIDGCLQVGKAMPYLQETAHLLPPLPPGTAEGLPSVFTGTQLETYVRADDSDQHRFADVLHTRAVPYRLDGQPDLAAIDASAAVGARAPGATPAGEVERDSLLMLFRIETLPAGTRLDSWLQLNHATALELAFFTDVLAAFTATGQIGGRSAVGHGRVRVELTRQVLRGDTTALDWRAHLTAHRDQALRALQSLT